ncbi:kielin/chordin-like protein [Physella acuta]|uniref:kielin/chordin-like protein n=1 Tax=Physella acuta TaxID=109671 RepID=UPI0027DE9C8A|nr:kielin/chordin-like protein [Physella acuta]
MTPLRTLTLLLVLSMMLVYVTAAVLPSNTTTTTKAPATTNGDNCQVNGNIIPADQTVSIEGRGDCYCVKDGSYDLRAECVLVTPLMTTPNENLDNSNPCYKCTCESNEKQCYYIDCFFDPCVDGYYEPGVCCKICPNGRNCAVGGTIIPDGTSVAVEGYGECHCSMDYNTFRLSAACTPQTPPMTTPGLPSTPGCDETIDNSDPCFVCECYNNERQCYVIDCAPLGCVDGYKKPGDCCTKCPNGNNCAVDGTIITENSRVYVDGHGECYCVINFEKYRLEAECVPPTDFPHTTPWLPPSTPASCEGLTNPAAGNPCMYCYCMNGIYECIIGDCGMPRCFDSVREPGACCSTCPNGENCEYGGSIIPYGQTVDVPFLGTCTCAENHYTGELLAQCIPFEPTTPPDPPTTPTGCYDGYVDSDDPCRRCECDGDQLMCYNIPCAWGKCVDGYTEPGQCCPTCPNGRNCKANGVIIPYGTPVLIEGIGYCYCVDETSTYWQGGVEVECLPLSTTPFTTPHTTPAMTTLYHEETTPVTPPQTTPATDAPWWETSQAPWEDTTTDPPPQGEVSSRPARSIREAVRRLMAKR